MLFRDRRWKVEYCDFQREDDYSDWCESIKMSQIANIELFYIHADLLEDNITPSNCDTIENYYTRQCVYEHAYRVGSMIESDSKRSSTDSERKILYQVWQSHPLIREICSGANTQYFVSYLEQLSKFKNPSFSTLVTSLSLDKKLWQEVNTVCIHKPQDSFCNLKKFVKPMVSRSERLLKYTIKNGWNDDVQEYKQILLVNLIFTRLNHPRHFDLVEPRDESSYYRRYTHIIQAVLNYLYSGEMAELTVYTSYLPSFTTYKCGNLFCKSDDYDCLFMKFAAQTTIFLQTTTAKGGPASVGSRTIKILNLNTDIKEFLKQKQVEHILKLVNNQQSQTTTLAKHLKTAFRVDLQNAVKELRNEINKTINNRFSELKTYFKKVEAFNSNISYADINYINSTINKYEIDHKILADSVQTNMGHILKTAVTLKVFELGEHIALMATLVASSLISKFTGTSGPDISDIHEQAARIAEAVAKVAEASKLLESLGVVVHKQMSIATNLMKNQQFINNVGKIISSIRGKEKLSIDEFDSLKEKFISKYTEYSPAVTKAELTELYAYWITFLTEACDLIDDTGTSIAAGIGRAGVGGSGICWKTAIDIEKLGETESEIYEHQFEIMNALASYVRAETAVQSADVINTKYAKLKQSSAVNDKTIEALELTTAFSFVTYKVQIFQAVLLYCDILEYKSGGVMPHVCQGFNTDLSLLISTSLPDCTRYHRFFTNVPTQPVDGNNQTYFDLYQLYRGGETTFKIPSRQWLLDAKWIDKGHKNAAIFVEQFEVYLPKLDPGIIDVTINIEPYANQIVPEGTTYVMYTNYNQNLKYAYSIGPNGMPCRLNVFKDPYQTCPDKKSFNIICPWTVDSSKTFHPSIYSHWKIKVHGFDQVNSTIPNPSSELSLTVGLKLCIIDHNKNKRKRSTVMVQSIPQPGCCNTDQYWSKHKNKCLMCPAGSNSVLGGYYCDRNATELSY